MRKKICFVVAISGTANAFLRDHIKALSQDYDVYLAGNIQDDKEVEKLSIKGWHQIDIERGISILTDLKAVRQLKSYFKKMKFDAVHSVTPKAGLVTALAGKLTGIKHRTHIFTGQVWATATGFKRTMLKNIDKLIAKLDNHILVDGKSQRSFLENEGVLKRGKAEVFGNGSISGVNSERFVPDKTVREEIRSLLNISENTTVFVFMGRLNHDKGIGELFEAYNRLVSNNSDVFLLLIGRDEEGYLDKLKDFPNIKDGDNFKFYGHTSEPEKVLNAGDVFVLPTYREGFGTSLLEAACIGLPCISTDAYGVQDAYVDGETGLQCKVGDVESLYDAMKMIHRDKNLRMDLGEKARKRALSDFKGEVLTKYWVDFYHQLIR